jgi:hypothetical protein
MSYFLKLFFTIKLTCTSNEGFTMYLDKADYDAMGLFNDKMDEFDGKGFDLWASKWASKNGQPLFHMDLSFGAMTVQLNGPDEDALRSFVLTFRFFIQDNEKCSIRKIADIYNKLPFDRIERQTFFNFRTFFNINLDADSPFTTHGVRWTRRQVIDTLMYGHFAHANDSKKEIADSWLSEENKAKLFLSQFITDLVFVYDFLILVRQLNRFLFRDNSIWIGYPFWV